VGITKEYDITREVSAKEPVFIAIKDENIQTIKQTAKLIMYGNISAQKSNFPFAKTKNTAAAARPVSELKRNTLLFFPRYAFLNTL
jgi:hypothetical protein